LGKFCIKSGKKCIFFIFLPLFPVQIPKSVLEYICKGNQSQNNQPYYIMTTNRIERAHQAYIQREKAKAMEDPNLHQTIKDMIVTTVANKCEADSSVHYRVILDGIISDLQRYAGTLPTANELFAANKL
jgi:hypothetical protein